jgi:hypothetical protein
LSMPSTISSAAAVVVSAINQRHNQRIMKSP